MLDTKSALISSKFLKEELGGDPHVIGRQIIIGGATQTIVGVLPTLADLYPDTDVADADHRACMAFHELARQ